MGIIPDIFNKLFIKKKKEETINVEQLRVEFKERYHGFKLLLSANSKSLEIMADIEKALSESRPFGMSFIRSNCTSISVNVFRMISKINGLAPGKYKKLYERFNDIQQRIEQLLTQTRVIKDDRLIIPLKAINKEMADLVGSKMANLGEIKKRLFLKIPAGFSITSYAYERFIEYNDLQAEINRRFQSADVDQIERLYTLSSEIQQHIMRSTVPGDLADAIMEAWKKIEQETGNEITMALRSSAVGEDEAGSTFAGQYRSVLNVSKENITHAYKEVIASKYSLQAISYRLSKGFKDEDIPMCVGCLVMVDPVAGGVTYSRNPFDTTDDSIFINAAWGLPKSVVDGSVACDLFVVSRENPMAIIQNDVRVKERKYVCFPHEGVCRMDLAGDVRNLPAIEQDQIFALAELAVKIEDLYASPQDIEWAIDSDDTIYILQCRTLQQRDIEKKVCKDTLKPSKVTTIARGGVTASPGAACGTVYTVNRDIDVLQFPKGAVLVTRQSLPRWASLLNRAVAVITEQGSFAGHLANVAREFGIPALFGVDSAMGKIQNGDLVTVDANNRVIYKGKAEYLLIGSASKKTLMEGSPVYETLKQVGRLITPLNLLDPDSLDFTPENCKTYHDITRFVHEKAVQEMFNFGREHNFSERSSKQLYYKVPMQWWILNLDDGFKKEVRGKYVKLENIVSAPMLAFWKGFTAIPWDGPPAIDGKGLISVMFQSTVNRSLTPGARSEFADRNYFMISKDYCSLNSRLGYHFSILEALVSDRAGENYISFQFKGGAADYHRKLKRIMLIKEILEEYDFTVEVNEDNLIARLEGYEKDYMYKHLEILGYLTLHTRQIDMIMSNNASVNYYKSKIDRDLQSIVCPQ
ncbi:MAG: PEP/pyruvate-binding domain-containing protein [Thermodesulfobacteriota bacterium]|nr:PEP/pyruvate-binding domain-containing protein [Thermodesulfobacteriota bacterium]